MFKNTFQSGFLSILYSLGYVRAKYRLRVILVYMSSLAVVLMKKNVFSNRSKPLQIWDKEGKRSTCQPISLFVLVPYVPPICFSELVETWCLLQMIHLQILICVITYMRFIAEAQRLWLCSYIMHDCRDALACRFANT